MSQRYISHQKQFKPSGQSRRQSPSQGSATQEGGNVQDYVNKTLDHQNTQNGADLKDAAMPAAQRPRREDAITHLQSSATAFGAASAHLEVAAEARPLPGNYACAGGNTAQGDVVDLDMDIDIESSQAHLSIQQPQIMEHENMKMRKGGDLFFGGRRGENDEVDERRMGHRHMPRQAYASTTNNLQAYALNMGQAQLDQPMVIKQQSSSSSNQARQPFNTSGRVDPSSAPRRQAKPRSASHNNGGQNAESRGIDFAGQAKRMPEMVRLKARVGGAAATQNLELAGLSSVGEKLQAHLSQTQQMRVHDPFRSKKHSNAALQPSSGSGPPSLLSQPLLSTQNMGRTLELQNLDNSQLVNSRVQGVARGQRTKSSMGVLSEYLNLNALAGGLQQRRQPQQQVGKRPTGSSSPILEQLKTLFNPASGGKEQLDQSKRAGEAARPGTGSGLGLLGYIERKSGLNLYKNVETHQDIDTNNEIKTSFVALDRENQKTLEHVPVETLNINAQPSHTGQYSMKSTQRPGFAVGPQTLATQAQTHFVQTQYLQTNTRQTMNETHMLSQKSRKSRGFNSPHAAGNVRSSQQMQTSCAGGTPKNFQAITQNIQIGQFNQSRQQAHQQQQLAQRAYTATRPPSQNLLSTIERIIKNNIVQSGMDRQLIEAAKAGKDGGDPRGQMKRTAGTTMAKRGSVPESLHLDLQALQSSNTNQATSKGERPAGPANAQVTPGISHQQSAAHKSQLQEKRPGDEHREFTQPDSVRSLMQVQQHTERLQSFYDSKFLGVQGQQSSVRRGGRRLESSTNAKGDAGVRQTLEQLKMQSPFQMNKALEPDGAGQEKGGPVLHANQRVEKLMNKQLLESVSPHREDSKGPTPPASDKEASPSAIGGSPPRLRQRQGQTISYQGSVLGGSVSESPIMERNYSSPSSLRHSESENVMDTIDREAVEIRNPNQMPGCDGSNGPTAATGTPGNPDDAKNRKEGQPSKQVFKLDLEKIKNPANKDQTQQPPKEELPAVLTELSQHSLITLEENNMKASLFSKRSQVFSGSNSNGLAEASSSRIKGLSAKKQRTATQRAPANDADDLAKDPRETLKMDEADQLAVGRSKSGTDRKAAGGASGSSTARISMGYLGGGSTGRGHQAMALGRSSSQQNLVVGQQTTYRSDQKIELSSLAPAIKESIVEEDGENEGEDIENQKYFNLITNFDQHKTLGQKVIDEIPRKAHKKSGMKDRKSIQGSKDASSFDSVNPQELILDTIDSRSKDIGGGHAGNPTGHCSSSHYASHLSQVSKLSNFSKIQNILNVQYLHTRSSNISSVHHYNTHQTQTSQQASDQISRNHSSFPTNKNSKASSSFSNADQQDARGQDNSEQHTKIDKFIDKIHENLNTFTTDQFEQLRETVKSKGFGEAQREAQAVFGLKRGTVRIKENVEGKREEETAENAGDGGGVETFELQDGLLRKVEIVEPGNAEVDPWAEEGPRTQQAICTGFLSAPSLAFYLDSEEEGEQDEKKNRHMATVREDLIQENKEQTLRGQSGQVPSFLLNHLISQRILSSFIRLKCQMISCGLEHCLALMSYTSEPLISNGQGSPGVLDEGEHQRGNARRIRPGFVYSWGLGNSGCLGHGDHTTLEEPRLITALAQATTEGGPLRPSVVYVEAGGYHNGAITSDNEAFLWGRGDVGQLGLSKDALTEDQRGHAALSPTPLELLDEKVVQLALGEVHTLILAEPRTNNDEQQQQLYSCGWNDLGQLGISAEQEEADKDLLRHKVRFDFEDQGESILQIKCGAVFSAALTAKGHVYAWGSNASGQMGGSVQASSGHEKSIESSDNGQAGQKMASSHGTQEHAFETRGPQRVMTPTRVTLDEEQPGVRVLDIMVGDRLVIANTKQSEVENSERLYAWGQGFLLDDHECQELVTNKPIILGGGLELTKKYVIEQEHEPNEDFSALLDPKEKKKAEAADEDTSQPQAAPAIAFQISATPYESKTAEPKKNDVVPRLELADIIVNQGKVQEAFQHNIPADSASGLRPSNLMSSTSSYVSSSHNQQPPSSKRQPQPPANQHFKPPVPRGFGPHGDVKLRRAEEEQEFELYKANTLPRAAKAENHVLGRSGSAMVGQMSMITPSANAQRQSAVDKESDLITVKNTDDYKNYLRNRENGDTDELSSLNKSDQKVLKFIMQDSNSRHSPMALKGQRGGGAAGHPSAWTSNGGGSERGNFIENNTNSCVTVNDANFPQGASDAYRFNSGSAEMDYHTTQYAQGSSPNELAGAALHSGTSYGGDNHSQHRAADHSNNSNARLAQNFNTNIKSDMPKSSANGYIPKQKVKNRDFKVSKPKFLNQSGSESSSNTGVRGSRANLTGGELTAKTEVLPTGHVVLVGPDAEKMFQNQTQQIKLSQMGVPQEQVDSASSNYRDGVVRILSPAQEVDRSVEGSSSKQRQAKVERAATGSSDKNSRNKGLEKNDGALEEEDQMADRNDYQSGPFKPMSSDGTVQPGLMEQKEGSRIKEKSPELKHVSQAQHVQIDLLGAEFKPSNPTVNRFTQGIMNNTRTVQGSISPMNPMLTISTPMRMQDQSSANNVLDTADQRQSSVECVAHSKSLQNDAKKLSQQASSQGLTKNDEITELNANSNRNVLQNCKSSRNAPEQTELVLQSSNSSANDSLRHKKQYEMQSNIKKSSGRDREQLRQRNGTQQDMQPFESKQSVVPLQEYDNAKTERDEAYSELEKDVGNGRPHTEMGDQLFMTHMEEWVPPQAAGASGGTEHAEESQESSRQFLGRLAIVQDTRHIPSTVRNDNRGPKGAHNAHSHRSREHGKMQTLRLPASSKLSTQRQMKQDPAVHLNSMRKFEIQDSSRGQSARQEESITSGTQRAQRQANLKVEVRTPGRSQATHQHKASVNTVRLQTAVHRAKNSCSQLSAAKRTTPIVRMSPQSSQPSALKRTGSGRQLDNVMERHTTRTEQLASDSKYHPEMATQSNLNSHGLQTALSRTKLRLVKSHQILKDYQPVLRSKDGPAGASATGRQMTTAQPLTAQQPSDHNNSTRLPYAKKLSITATPAISSVKLRTVSKTKPTTPVKATSLAPRSTGKKSQQASQQSQGSHTQMQSGGDLTSQQSLPVPARQLFGSTVHNKRGLQ